MDIILEYFHVTLKWNNDIPIINLKLKKCKKIRRDIPIKTTKTGRNICDTGINYYTHFLGDSIGKTVYNERKKLYSKNKLVLWYMNSFLLTPNETEKMNNYLIIMSDNLKKSLNLFYSTDSEKLNKTKELYKLRSKVWSKKIGNLNSKLWENKEWRDQIMLQREQSGMYKKMSTKMKFLYSNTDFKNNFNKLMNLDDRIDKISKSSKKMWAKWKKNNIEMYRYMMTSLRSKKFTLNNKKMTSIEYEIAVVLDELGLEWEYEPVFHFDNISYIPDFFIKSKNVILECYGDYWHANSKFFNANDILYKNITAADKWKYDFIKKEVFTKNGYKFLIFWESDIKLNINNIKEEIRNGIC